MSWKWFKLFHITCDRCGAPGPADPQRAGAAREAVAVGWIALGPPLRPESQWHCPACKETAVEQRQSRC
jgi:hypothetical protein